MGSPRQAELGWMVALGKTAHSSGRQALPPVISHKGTKLGAPSQGDGGARIRKLKTRIRKLKARILKLENADSETGIRKLLRADSETGKSDSETKSADLETVKRGFGN